MFTPQLRIPEQKAISASYQGVLPDEIAVQNWLNSRVHTDKQGFLDTLVSLNRVQCKPSIRMGIMKLIDTEIEKELDDLFNKTKLVTFPVNEEYQVLSDTMQHLLLESSLAYQIIISDIAANEDYVSQYLGSLLPESLFMALFYLSRLLVERFQLYLSEPAYVWQELNQLYLLAERIGAQENEVRMHTSIKNKYLQIVILRLLNPYRMMHLEARKIYQLLEKWAEQCEIVGYVQQKPENDFVVNLLSDFPPHHFEKDNDSKENNAGMFEGRVLKMNKLRTYLKNYLDQIEHQKQSHVLSYQARMHNDMFQRIDNEMRRHQERSQERSFVGNNIKLLSGLRACHHFISDRKAFEPQAEIDARLQQKLEENQHRDDSGINLISLLEEEKLLNKMNPMGELQSINPFLKESDVMGDAWDRVYASSVIHANVNETQKQLNSSLKEENWRQKNESAHGMLLVSKNDIEMPIAVGMLVAYRLSVEKAYCLAVVKWLRLNPRKGMAIGVKLIAVQSRAIAVKGETGAGAGGEFQRAFLISENDTQGKGGKLHLIVSAGIYDKGSILKVWHNNKLNRVQITQILLATDSFKQVAFSVVGKKK